MPRTTLTVFLSSTAQDFESYRDVLIEAIDATDYFKCDAMERFGPQDAAAIALCRKKVQEADLFVSLVGMRRGWEPEGDNKQRSITEMEYDWACEFGRKRYVCVTPEDFAMPGNLRNTDAEHERQLAFRARVKGERVAGVRSFASPEKLALEIVTRLLSDLVASDLIKHVRPDLSAAEAAEAKPQVAAAIEKLAEDQDVDLLELAKNTGDIDPAELEGKLKARAEQHEAAGKAAQNAENKKAAGYWRHLGALAYLNETQKSLEAYRKATALDPDDADGWNLLGHLLVRVGDLDQAKSAYESVMALGTQAGSRELEARATGNLGLICFKRADYVKAEEMHLRSLSLAEELGIEEYAANQYGNLANICAARGDLVNAQELNLKCLALNEQLGFKDGMALAYGNLGLIYATRGDLDRAEEMHRKSLAINEELDCKEGMATTHANLGLMHEARGDLAAACASWRKARNLYAEIGMPHMVGKVETMMREAGCGET